MNASINDAGLEITLPDGLVGGESLPLASHTGDHCRIAAEKREIEEIRIVALSAHHRLDGCMSVLGMEGASFVLGVQYMLIVVGSTLISYITAVAEPSFALVTHDEGAWRSTFAIIASLVSISWGGDCFFHRMSFFQLFQVVFLNNEKWQ